MTDDRLEVRGASVNLWPQIWTFRKLCVARVACIAVSQLVVVRKMLQFFATNRETANVIAVGEEAANVFAVVEEAANVLAVSEEAANVIAVGELFEEW